MKMEIKEEEKPLSCKKILLYFLQYYLASELKDNSELLHVSLPKEIRPCFPINISDKKSSMVYPDTISSQSSHLDDMINSMERKGILKRSLEDIGTINNDLYTQKSEKKKKCINFEQPENTPSIRTKSKVLETLTLESPLIKEKFKSKLYGLITKLYLTKKFMSKLRNATVYRKPKWLKSFHYKIINDWSFFTEGVNKKAINLNKIKFEKTASLMATILYSFGVYLRSKLKQNNFLMKISKVIHPNKIFHVIFDMVILITTMFCFFIIYLDMGFNIDFVNLELVNDLSDSFLVKRGGLGILLFDILLNFNTAYYEKGELIQDRLKIVRNYIKGNFLEDLISLMYFFFGGFYSYPYENMIIKASGFLFLLRMRNIKVIFARLEEFLFLDQNYYNYLLFFKLIIRLLYVAHFFACLWHFIGMINADQGPNWLQAAGIINDYWWKRYVSSFYYVAVVMNTVGFGDITPQNMTETAFTILFIYLACGMFAYTINSVGIILQNINKNEREFKRNMNLINGFMRQKHINFDLRTKIRNYLEYIWKEERIEDNDASLEVINKLSKSLREELLLNANGIILKNFPLFENNFSEGTLRKLIYEMKEINMTPGDTIYRQTDTHDPAVYIIRKGKVELFIQTLKRNEPITILQTLKKGELFGEISFFSDLPRETHARCSTFASFYVIKRPRFIEILKENAEDYEIFCQIKDNINLYQEYGDLCIVCSSCKESTHPTIFCPFLHLKLSHQRILQKFNYNKSQERNNFTRTNKKNPDARDRFYENKTAAKRIFSDMNSSENHTLLSSNKIESNSIANLEINQISSKNSLFLTNGGPIRKSEEKSLISINEDFPKEIKKKKKKTRSFSTSLIMKDKNHSQTEVISSEQESLFSNLKKLKNDKLEKSVEKIEKIKNSSNNFNIRDDESSNSNNSSNSSKHSNKIKSITENPNTTTINNFQTDVDKNNIYDDICKEYVHYFPHNNVDDVTEKVNGIIFNNLKKKKCYKFRSIKKSWVDLSPNKTLKSVGSSSIYKKKKSSKFRDAILIESNFFEKSHSRRKSSMSRMKVISILRENKIWNKKTGFFEKIKSIFK